VCRLLAYERPVSPNGELLSRHGRSSPANAGGLDTHRDSISSRLDCRPPAGERHRAARWSMRSHRLRSRRRWPWRRRWARRRPSRPTLHPVAVSVPAQHSRVTLIGRWNSDGWRRYPVVRLRSCLMPRQPPMMWMQPLKQPALVARRVHQRSPSSRLKRASWTRLPRRKTTSWRHRLCSCRHSSHRYPAPASHGCSCAPPLIPLLVIVMAAGQERVATTGIMQQHQQRRAATVPRRRIAERGSWSADLVDADVSDVASRNGAGSNPRVCTPDATQPAAIPAVGAPTGTRSRYGGSSHAGDRTGGGA
jgi:hypothetical protein